VTGQRSMEGAGMPGSAAPSEAAGHPAYRITLPEFEGPLDLLLHLCQTHELDILNISISFVAEKYIEYLELMENMSVEVAADYLVMAAHLAYLKSRELVPSPEPLEASEDGEEPIDPREELIRRLLEYQKYKHAAQDLGSRPIEGRNVFVRGAVLEAEAEAGLAEHSVWKLLEHWAQILVKTKPKHTHDVVVDRISISDRINQLVDLLESGNGTIQFEDLIGEDLPEAEIRHKVVVSLLAVLELARLRVVRILQQESTGAFFLARVEGVTLDDARHLNVTSANEPGGEPNSESPEVPVEAGAAPEPVPAEAPGTPEAAAPTVVPFFDVAPDEASATIQADASDAPVAEASSAGQASDSVDVPTDILADALVVAASEAASAVPADALDAMPAVESDTALAQDDVISAPSTAPLGAAQDHSDGETQEAKETSTE
jgi:segregation and condensation protein A